MSLFRKPKTNQKIDFNQEECFQEDKNENEMIYGEKEKGRQTKIPLTHRTWAKVMAFFLLIILSVLSVASIGGAFAALELELYTTPEASFKKNVMEELIENDVSTLLEYLSMKDAVEGEELALYLLDDRNIASLEISFSDEAKENWIYQSEEKKGATEFSVTLYHIKPKDSKESFYTSYSDFGDYYEHLGTFEVSVSLAEQFTKQDCYYLADVLVSLAYALRYWIYVVILLSLLGSISSFIFLMCSAGRKSGLLEAQPGWGTKVPFDLLTGAVLFAGLIICGMIQESGYFVSAWKILFVVSALGLGLEVILLGWCMSFATRIKLGQWWKNTLIYHCLKIIFKALKKIWKGTCIIFHMAGTLAKEVPLVWKAALVSGALAVLELCIIICSWGEMDVLVIFWFFINLILIPIVLYTSLMLRKLQKGGEALASGDLSFQVNTKRMFWDFKNHGENLNRIGEGMTAAVEQRLKSERMKTELITNVSHDIKTPLTSIINYADLIKKESCENPAIQEYIDVLERQSNRLKRLIEDLVEASKASTGNLEVFLAPCEVGVMLSQTAGEYEKRLSDSGLQLVTNQPEEEIKIMADGRRLWRVFDNLMNNICKYGQKDTRVYLTLERQGNQAVITFKNISKEPLNLSAEELMERFVQGDASRRSEGNGLGLSIARSLTELQNGTMEVTTDGDLFKVVLRFPVMELE